MRTLDRGGRARATRSRRSTWCSGPRPGGRRAPCSAPPTSSAWTRWCTSRSNCYDALPSDERRDVFELPAVLQQLIAKKWLGAKTKQGFYKKVGDDILQLDLKTLEYVPQKKPRFDSIGATRGVDDVDEKMRAHGRRQRSRRRAGAHGALRDADLLGEPAGRDRRRRRRHRPRAALGLRLGARAVRDLGRAGRQGDGRRRWRPPATPCPAGSRSRSPPRAKGCASIAQDAPGKLGAARQARRLHADPDRPARSCRWTRSAPRGGEVERNGSASILDLGDGVFCLEFHAKMNAIDPDIVTMTMKAVDRAERDGVGAGDRQRRARRVLRGRQPVRPDDGARCRGT